MSDEHDSEFGADPVVETRYSDDEPPSQAIIRALATAEGIDPIDLDVLYDSIDPEALDSLLGPRSADQPTTVGFGASGYRVVVSSDGRITVLDGHDQE